MSFNWRTKDGLQNLLNLVSLAIMSLAGAYFGWGDAGPGPAPPIEILAVADVAADSSADVSQSGYMLTAVYADEARAQQAADDLTEADFNPTSGLSFAAILAILNLIARFLPSFSQPKEAGSGG